MQTAKKLEYDTSAKIIHLNIHKLERRREHALQNESEKMSCFRTDERYFCKDKECVSWNECKKLVAEWMRL